MIHDTCRMGPRNSVDHLGDVEPCGKFWGIRHSLPSQTPTLACSQWLPQLVIYLSPLREAPRARLADARCNFRSAFSVWELNFYHDTHSETNSSPLKKGRNPKWKDGLPTIHFQVRAVSFGEGVLSYCIFTNPPPKKKHTISMSISIVSNPDRTWRFNMWVLGTVDCRCCVCVCLWQFFCKVVFSLEWECNFNCFLSRKGWLANLTSVYWTWRPVSGVIFDAVHLYSRGIFFSDFFSSKEVTALWPEEFGRSPDWKWIPSLVLFQWLKLHPFFCTFLFIYGKFPLALQFAMIFLHLCVFL